MKIRACILLFILLHATGVAQTDTCKGSLQGRIIDEHDKTPLEFATVYLVELKRGVLSDSKGNYKMDHLCNGPYTVKVSHLGCEPVEVKIIIKGKTVKNFYPEHHAELLKDVEVTVKKPDDQTTQTRNDVPEEKMNQSKGLPLGEALKSVTGVNSLNTGNSISKPVIHGMHSNRILLLNNGIRQEGQQWGVEHAPEVDPFIAGKLSVIKGANSVRYGSDAIGGVVVIDPKPLPDTAGVAGELNLVGASNGRGGTASAYLEGNFKKLMALSWRAQGTFKQNGSVSAPSYNLINTALKEYNFSYALKWTKKNYGADVFYSQFNTSLGIFGASHIGNVTDLRRAFESPAPLETGPFSYKINRPYQHIEHELFKFNSFVRTGTAGKLLFVYARQYNLRNEYDKHGPLNDSLAALGQPELQFELTTHTADLIWEHNAYKRFTGSVGISGITQGNTYEGRALIPNFRNNSAGVFWLERWRKNRVELEGGLRYDYKSLEIYRYEYTGNASYELATPVHTFQNVSGNLGAIYKRDSTLNLSVNVGSAWRSPSVSELYSNGLHHGAAAMEYGDDSLQTERTYNAIFTARYTPGKRLAIEVSPYVHFIRGFIYRQPAPAPVVTIRGAFPAFFYRQTDAVLRGCDLYLNYKLITRMEITARASLLRAWNKTENNWLIMMPSDRYETELIYRFKPYKALRSSYLSTSILYVTRQWRVPANSDFVPPPGEYYTLNAHANCIVELKKQKIELGLSVFNLLNRSYRDYLDRFRYFTDAMGRNIVLRLTYHFN